MKTRLPDTSTESILHKRKQVMNGVFVFINVTTRFHIQFKLRCLSLLSAMAGGELTFTLEPENYRH